MLSDAGGVGAGRCAVTANWSTVRFRHALVYRGAVVLGLGPALTPMTYAGELA
jgi:hypothetical protein